MTRYRIAEARAAKGWTQSDLAKRIGTTQQQIARYESGENDVKSSVLIKMSRALEVTISYLLGMSNVDGIIPNREDTMCRVPVFGRIAAGDAREAIQQSDDWHDTPSALVAGKDEAFWLTISGNSMNRLFPDGTLVLVDPAEEVHDGNVAALFVNGDDATVKRVYFESGSTRLHPESYDPEYRDRVIDKTDPDAPEVRMIGKVVSYTAPAGWRA